MRADGAAEFDELYEASQYRLVRQLFAFTGDEAGARDLVQEAFMRAWSRWERVSSYDDPEAWVRRVAYNLAKNSFRRRSRLVPWTGQVPRHAPAADALAEPPVGSELLTALGRLPADQRRAIVLHHLSDLSVDEVATEMAVPSGTVKSWLSRGRARLGRELGQTGGTAEEIAEASNG